jgi:hypothetical protein
VIPWRLFVRPLAALLIDKSRCDEDSEADWAVDGDPALEVPLLSNSTRQPLLNSEHVDAPAAAANAPPAASTADNSVSNMPAAVINACNVVAVTAAAALAAVPDLTVPTAGADAADATASAAFSIVAAADTVVSVAIAAAGLSSAATTRF